MDKETNDMCVDNELKSATEVLDDYIDYTDQLIQSNLNFLISYILSPFLNIAIYNLGSEVVQSLTELHILDEQLEKLRAIYKECQEKYFEILEESDQSDEEEKIVSYWKDKTEKAYDDALHKQDEKIAVADKLYSLISRHLERLDDELARNNINLDRDDDFSDMEFDPNEPLYCFCRRQEFGNMIQCDHPRCENAWYHWDCVGLTQQPSGQWFCPDCEFRPYEPIPINDLMIEGFAMYSYPDQGLDDFTLSNPPFH
ncbi:380_t:CDS:2, partial [Funneliformis geosporum]